MTGRLKRVMVRRPAAPSVPDNWKAFGYLHAVDHDRALEDHAAFIAILEREGAEVIIEVGDESGDLDALFAYDPSLMTDQGATLLGMGKTVRQNEPAFHARTYEELDIPVVGIVVPQGTREHAAAADLGSVAARVVAGDQRRGDRNHGCLTRRYSCLDAAARKNVLGRRCAIDIIRIAISCHSPEDH
jgi:N-dimethylarginine dimethylaminohydrolase